MTAFTTSADQEAEARDLGAHAVVDTTEPGALTAHANTCDLLPALERLRKNEVRYRAVLVND